MQAFPEQNETKGLFNTLCLAATTAPPRPKYAQKSVLRLSMLFVLTLEHAHGVISAYAPSNAGSLWK